VKTCTRCGAAFQGEGQICPHCRRELDEAGPGGSQEYEASHAAAPEGGHGHAPSAHAVAGRAEGSADAPPQGGIGETDPEEGLTRSRFLTNTALTVGGAIGVGYLALGLRLLFPNVSAASTPLQDVGPVAKFPSMSPTLTTIIQDNVQDGVYVVNLSQGTPSQNQLIALDFHCTHLNCPVTWYPGVNGVGRYICPCHGSQFTIEGVHVAGPAPRPMFRHQVVLKNGRVLIGGIIS